MDLVCCLCVAIHTNIQNQNSQHHLQNIQKKKNKNKNADPFILNSIFVFFHVYFVIMYMAICFGDKVGWYKKVFVFKKHSKKLQIVFKFVCFFFQGMEPKLIKEETVEKDTTSYIETPRTRSSKGIKSAINHIFVRF